MGQAGEINRVKKKKRNRVIHIGFNEKVTFNQRLKGGGVSQANISG